MKTPTATGIEALRILDALGPLAESSSTSRGYLTIHHATARYLDGAGWAQQAGTDRYSRPLWTITDTGREAIASATTERSTTS